MKLLLHSITVPPARLLLMMAALFVSSCVFADEVHTIILSKDTTKSISFGYCNIFVSRSDENDEDNPLIRVMVENTDDTEIMILFHHAYTEKDLNNLYPKITYDKYFIGTKGHRVIEPCENLGNDLRINPTRKQEFTKKVSAGGSHTFRLPFYFAKPRNKSGSKLLLKEKNVIELTVNVPIKQDPDYPRLKEATDKLVDSLTNISFCPNPLHSLSIEEQEAPYEELRNNLLHAIDSISQARGWFQNDAGYTKLRYDSLKQVLKSIVFKDYEKDCGRHWIPRPIKHNCAYCSLSLEGVYRKMDGDYQKIYAAHGEDRKQKKKKYEGEIKALYKCSKKNKQRKGNPALVSKIARLYNSFPRL